LLRRGSEQKKKLHKLSRLDLYLRATSKSKLNTVTLLTGTVAPPHPTSGARLEGLPWAGAASQAVA